ncbi:MAG: hypothetical protein KatS3mg111_3703 [Pirellulaceae bacterium]|nr:MAG: hypothetical protein KatS3mg111_3703 [Pirellulaceae bacterium]
MASTEKGLAKEKEHGENAPAKRPGLSQPMLCSRSASHPGESITPLCLAEKAHSQPPCMASYHPGPLTKSKAGLANTKVNHLPFPTKVIRQETSPISFHPPHHLSPPLPSIPTPLRINALASSLAHHLRPISAQLVPPTFLLPSTQLVPPTFLLPSVGRSALMVPACLPPLGRGALCPLAWWPCVGRGALPWREKASQR